METIRAGFVGLGIMGMPMASNLLRSGVPLSVYNRTASKCEPLAAMGAKTCTSLSELAREWDVAITVVSDTADVESVLFAPGGLAESLRSGSVLIDMSTISPGATVEFARRLSERSVAMLDAPVSGGEAGAKAGTLSIMVGGERAVYQRCLPLFHAMGKNVIYMGPHGNGQRTKLVNQVVGALNLLATVEGIRLASAAGLDVENALKAIGGGAAASWMLSNIGPKIAQRDFTPGFTIRLQDKDMRLALELFRELGMDAPGTGLTASIFRQAVERGFGEIGNHGIYRLWERASGS